MKKLLIALVASATAMSAAQAQVVSKPYIGFGVTSTNHELNVSGTTTTISGDRKAAGKIFGGVEITPMFGVELGHSESRDDHGVSFAGRTGNAETDSSRTYIAGKATMPLSDKFSLYGKLGVVHTSDKTTAPALGLSYKARDNGLYAGVGAQYSLSEKVALSLEYERNGKKRDFGAKPDAVTVSARYNF